MKGDPPTSSYPWPHLLYLKKPAGWQPKQDKLLLFVTYVFSLASVEDLLQSRATTCKLWFHRYCVLMCLIQTAKLTVQPLVHTRHCLSVYTALRKLAKQPLHCWSWTDWSERRGCQTEGCTLTTTIQTNPVPTWSLNSTEFACHCRDTGTKIYNECQQQWRRRPVEPKHYCGIIEHSEQDHFKGLYWHDNSLDPAVHAYGAQGNYLLYSHVTGVYWLPTCTRYWWQWNIKES